MAASACLRILLDVSDEQFAKLNALGPLVTKVTSAFLETRWAWPKRFEIITAFSFMLTDPRALEVDVALLERLADELQVKLFGASSSGDVTLLLHDGDAADTARFVQIDNGTMRRLTQAPMGPTPFGGRLMQISAAAGAPMSAQWRPLQRDGGQAPVRPAADAEPSDTDFHGIYFVLHQLFIGDALSANTPSALARFSIVDGAEQMPGDHAMEFDLASLTAGAQLLAKKSFVGSLFLPICYSSLMRESARDAYADKLKPLQLANKKQLAAVIYGVPRVPNFQVFAKLKDLLETCFSYVDLQVTDPGFEIDNVPAGSATSVTLRLPEADERARLAALKRFMERRETYRRLRIWPAVTNVRTQAEIQACVREKACFLSGRAICGAMAAPVGNLTMDPARLPLVPEAA